MNILAIHTSTHDIRQSSSAALTRDVVQALARKVPSPVVRWIDASKLHIVPNLSCYANGLSHCADPKSGPYRCWAHFVSKKDPAQHGGEDQMPVIYDGLAWADIVLFSTSTRWGTHSALCQKIIERMNTLENRGAALGEKYPMLGKKLGIVATGTDWRTGEVTKRMLDTLRWWGFATSEDYACTIAWQRSGDPYYEQPDNNKPVLDQWVLTPQGQRAVDACASAIATAKSIAKLRPS